ncbi:MAG TPA: twin-arginine translocase TatA/TatE family subunit [Acidimicrobiia bacterium]|nr:twin-arginine translocase TatA/TatE family subunit [Acidimicrobiia bacterium]
MSLGPAEILVILVLALVVFGPSRLPEVSRQVGGAMREFRRVQGTVRRELADTLRDDADVPRRPGTPRAPEPDHDDAPPPPEPVDRGFEGPPGSFS